MSEGSCSQTWVNRTKYCGELLKCLNYLNPLLSRREANVKSYNYLKALLGVYAYSGRTEDQLIRDF